jgi:hypothetical protein
MPAKEVTQEQFDKASALFTQIDELKIERRNAGTLQEKFDINYKISRLIQERYEILGLR